MEIDVQQYETLAKQLVQLFHPHVEVGLFDINTLKCVFLFNALSNKKVDQGVSAEDVKREDVRFEVLHSGKQVRITGLQLANNKGLKRFYLRIRFDVTAFEGLKHALDQLFPALHNESDEHAAWQQRLDRIISEFISQAKINLDAITKSEKRILVSKLYQHGMFDYKDAASGIAKKLNVTRASIYNYLAQARLMNRVHVHQVNAFTDKKFEGNPAGVVLDAEALPEELMKSIARELNYSETSYVLPSKKADFKLKYFTCSGQEVDFCGHSTVGAVYMLSRDPKRSTFSIETNVGVLSVGADITNGRASITFELPKIDLSVSSTSFEEFSKASGLGLELINTNIPLTFEKTNRDLFVTLKSLSQLKTINCDIKSLSAFCKKKGIVAVCFLVPEAISNKNDIHMRCFAPAVGIQEDPFTGSVLGGLVAHVHQNKLIPSQKRKIRVEQGHFIDRPGEVEVTFNISKGQYHGVAKANAIHFLSTEIELNREVSNE